MLNAVDSQRSGSVPAPTLPSGIHLICVIPIDWYTSQQLPARAASGYSPNHRLETPARSPSADCRHHDSCVYSARSQSSGMPHLCAPHWMRSSVEGLDRSSRPSTYAFSGFACTVVSPQLLRAAWNASTCDWVGW